MAEAGGWLDTLEAVHDSKKVAAVLANETVRHFRMYLM